MNKLQRVITIILFGIAAIATLYNVCQLMPLFSTFFIHDDFEILNQGPHLRADPFYIFTYHYKSFWRPLGFGLTGIVYLFSGFNTLPYHVLGYLVHLATALAVFFLGKRFFNLHIGLIAYIFYVFSPVSFCAPGFVSSTYQDELAACLLVLALALAYRNDGRGDKKPYWGSTLVFFAAALCKESWLFFYLPLLVMDWANYPRSTLGGRIHRMLPLLVVIILLPLRILVVGYSQIAEVASYDMSCFLYPQNLWLGLGQTFFPLDITDAQTWEYIAQFTLTSVFLIVPWIICKDKKKLAVIYIALISLWFVTSISAQMNGFRGWIHLQSMAAFTSIIKATTLSGLLLIISQVPAWIVIVVALIGLNVWGGKQTQGLVEVTLSKSEYYRVTFDSFKELLGKLPTGSHIYMLGGLSSTLVKDSLLLPGMSYTQVTILTPEETASAGDNELAGDLNFLMGKLARTINQPETHIIQRMPGGQCADITEAIRTAAAQGKPLPFYRGKQ